MADEEVKEEQIVAAAAGQLTQTPNPNPQGLTAAAAHNKTVDPGQRIAGVTEDRGIASRTLAMTEGKEAGVTEGINLQPAELPGIVKAGKNNFAAIYKQGEGGKAGLIIKLSDQERVVLTAFLTSQCYEAAAKEAGITVASVKRMLRRPGPKSYLSEVIHKAAVMQNMDAAWLAKEMMSVWEGSASKNEIQMKAAKIIENLVAPKGHGGVVVNVQQNSSYSNLGKEALNAEWANARAAADPGV